LQRYDEWVQAKFGKFRPILVNLAFLTLVACGGSRPSEDAIDPDKVDLIDALTLFVEAVQGDRFDKAFEYLTPAEKRRMLDSGDQPSADIKRRLKALRLSTLAQKSTVRLQGGKVEGIFEQLPSLGPLPEPPQGDAAGERQPEVPSFQ
jgi:hypothetical protein